jgi:hypothetical protein
MKPIVPGRPGKPNPWLRTPRYARRLHALAEQWLEEGVTRPGRDYLLEISHDAWCDSLNDRGPCTCNPCIGRPREVGAGPFPEAGVLRIVHVAKVKQPTPAG